MSFAVGILWSSFPVLLAADGVPLFSRPAPDTSLALGNQIAVGDLDGDGELDTVSDGAGHLCIARCDGIGGFAVTGAAPFSFVVTDLDLADVDADGDLDVVIAGGTSFLHLAKNAGNGALGPWLNEVRPSPYSWSRQLEFRDFDGDGFVDVLAAGGDAQVRFGDGTGAFGNGSKIPLRRWISRLEVGDFDADGRFDAVAVFEEADGVSLLRGLPGGTFAPIHPIFPFPAPLAVTITSLNGDAFDDLLLASDDEDAVWGCVGNGQMQFTKIGRMYAGSRPNAIAAGDVDGDGRVDAVVSDVSVGGAIHVGRGDGAGGFVSSHARHDTFGATTAALGDFDGDARPDAVAGGTFHGGLGFVGAVAQPRPAPESLSIPILGPALATLCADLDLDGDSDVVIVRDQPGTAASVDTYLCDGAAGFSISNTINILLVQAPLPQLIDYDGDALPDLVISGQHQIFVFRGTGSGFAQLPLFAATASGHVRLEAVEVGGDARPDLVAIGPTSIFRIVNTGQIGSVVPTVFALGDLSNWHDAAIGDADGDGLAEVLLVKGSTIDVVAISGPSLAPIASIPTEPLADLRLHDLDGDGFDDLIQVRNGSHPSPTVIRRGLGAAQFGPPAYARGRSVGAPVYGDFDGDGGIDIARLVSGWKLEVTRTSGGGFVVGNDRYHVRGSVALLGEAQKAAAGDFDGDGMLDLAYAWTTGVDSASLEIERNVYRPGGIGTGKIVGVGCANAAGIVPRMTRSVGVVGDAIRHVFHVRDAAPGSLGLLAIAALPSLPPAPGQCGSYLGAPLYFATPFLIPAGSAAIGAAPIAFDLRPGTSMPDHSAQAFFPDAAAPTGWSATNAVWVRRP